MNANRLLTCLVILTLGVQGILLVRLVQTTQAPQSPEMIAMLDEAAPFDLRGRPTRGSDGARAVIVEFADYECPFCRRHATTVAKEIDQAFVATGQLKQVFVNCPLPNHLRARALASAAMCAGEQDRYWEMYETLFALETPPADLSLVADGLDLDAERFSGCLERGHDEQLDRDFSDALDLGVRVTPSFALGVIDVDGVSIRTIISGAVSFESFEPVIIQMIEASQ